MELVSHGAVIKFFARSATDTFAEKRSSTGSERVYEGGNLLPCSITFNNLSSTFVCLYLLWNTAVGIIRWWYLISRKIFVILNAFSREMHRISSPCLASRCGINDSTKAKECAKALFPQVKVWQWQVSLVSDVIRNSWEFSSSISSLWLCTDYEHHSQTFWKLYMQYTIAREGMESPSIPKMLNVVQMWQVYMETPPMPEPLFRWHGHVLSFWHFISFL